jgi:hypothetical protein
MSSGTTLREGDKVSQRVVLIRSAVEVHRDATYGILQVIQVSPGPRILPGNVITRLSETDVPNFAVERIHLLKRMTLELSAIQRLDSNAWRVSPAVPRRRGARPLGNRPDESPRWSCAHLRDEEGRMQATKTRGAARRFRSLGCPGLQLAVGLCRPAFAACHGQCLVTCLDPAAATRIVVLGLGWTVVVV